MDFKLLKSAGKDYPWVRPSRCPRCLCCGLWGHGYVSRYFEEAQGPHPMKRWWCPGCHAVITMRPLPYWRRFLAAIETIRRSLEAKLEGGHWIAGASRQRQQYWWRGFRKQSHFDGVARSLAELLEAGVIAATHSTIYREVRLLRLPVHPSLAVTPRLGSLRL